LKQKVSAILILQNQSITCGVPFISAFHSNPSNGALAVIESLFKSMEHRLLVGKDVRIWKLGEHSQTLKGSNATLQ
jgi:hypothetical protein